MNTKAKPQRRGQCAPGHAGPRPVVTAGTAMGYVLARSQRRFSVALDQRLPDGAYAVSAFLRLRGTHTALFSGSDTFVLSGGKITRGKATPEMMAAIEANRFRFWLQPDALESVVALRRKAYQTIRVVNLTASPLRLIGRPMVWQVDDEGTKVFRTMAEAGLPEAITMRPAQLDLQPHAAQNLVLTCSMPADARGDLFLALVLAAPDEKLPTDFLLLAQHAVMIVAQAQGTAEPKAEISELKVKPSEDGPRHAIVQQARRGHRGLEWR